MQKVIIIFFLLTLMFLGCKNHENINGKYYESGKYGISSSLLDVDENQFCLTEGLNSGCYNYKIDESKIIIEYPYYFFGTDVNLLLDSSAVFYDTLSFKIINKNNIRLDNTIYKNKK